MFLIKKGVYNMNRVYNLTRVNSPLRTTMSLRRMKHQKIMTESSIFSPLPKNKIQKNQSLVCLESILKLPKIHKEYKIDIIDKNFMIQYFENKKRVELTYRQRNISNTDATKEEQKEEQKEAGGII
jgi:hypothetical protein